MTYHGAMPLCPLAAAQAWAVGLFTVSLGLPAQELDPRATDLDRRVMARFEGRAESPRAVAFYDPERVSEAQRDAAIADIEAGFDELEALFEMKYDGRILAFLYADGTHMRQLTGSDAVAFSTGTVSLHQPHDFRGVHELTHLFAMQFPREPHAVTDMFVTEGLATILAKHDQGVGIHDWASIDAKAGRLPDLLELRKTFPEGAPPGVHPYHVAGSFVGYLIERFGMRKMLGFYVHCTEAQHWFGQPVRALEFEWRQWLLDRDVEAQPRAHVLRQLSLPTDTLPAALRRDSRAVDLIAPTAAGSPLQFDDPDVWSTAGTPPVLAGRHSGPWSHARSAASTDARTAVFARLRLARGDAVKIWCNGGASPNEAIFARWGTFLSSGQGFGGVPHCKLVTGAWNDVALVNDGETLSLYLNGIRIAQTEDIAGSSAGDVGIAVEKGEVATTHLSVVSW